MGTEVSGPMDRRATNRWVNCAVEGNKSLKMEAWSREGWPIAEIYAYPSVRVPVGVRVEPEF